MKALAALALVLGLLAPSADAGTPPANARPGQRPPLGSDEDALWYAMERAERELQASPQRVADPALNAYLRDVACRVAADYCKDLRLYLLERPGFNASMAPNGMLLLWTGALLRLRDEAELALLLGHEFAHFRQRHSLLQWRKAKRTTAFMASFGLATYGGGAGAAAPLAGIAGAASMLRLSRTAEREADRLGFAAAVAAGYDPAAGERLWQRFLAEEEQQPKRQALPVFASHPDTPARLKDVRAAAAGFTGQGQRREQTAYQAQIAAHLPRWLEGELSRRRFDASIEVIARLREDLGTAQRGLTDFYLAEAYRRRGQPQDRERAAPLYAAAITQPQAPAAAFREWGYLLRERDDTTGAATALRRYLALLPQADDAAFVRRDLEALEPRP